MPFYKIASMDVTYLPLLRYAAQKQRPMVLATGMATLGEIERAVETVRSTGNEQLLLLHCVSIYPPEMESIRLRNIPMLREAFDGWLRETIALPRDERDQRLASWEHAPSARRVHPREEHLLPLMVVAGAAGDDRGSVPFSGKVFGKAISAAHFG